ncbi:hypothetical protein K432DRAFT_291045, partial [Lepidopterella palustris CBS 459.81]
ISVYRLYLNPLRQFPGETFAALSKWHRYNLARVGQTNHYLSRQHRKYDDIVRVGPNEISVADP